MYAIIETGGKQYKVQEGSVLDVERISSKEGEDIVFGNVLLVNDEGAIKIGSPYLEGAKVIAQLIRDFRDKKVIAFKFRRRKSSKTTKGHRQNLSKVKIKSIAVS